MLLNFYDYDDFEQKMGCGYTYATQRIYPYLKANRKINKKYKKIIKLWPDRELF